MYIDEIPVIFNKYKYIITIYYYSTLSIVDECDQCSKEFKNHGEVLVYM